MAEHQKHRLDAVVFTSFYVVLIPKKPIDRGHKNASTFIKYCRREKSNTSCYQSMKAALIVRKQTCQ